MGSPSLHIRSFQLWHARLSTELRSLLQEIPASPNIKADFGKWRTERLMAHYKAIKPWCELILNENSPMVTVGTWNGMSLLFPMERLFERYVAYSLKKHLHIDAALKLTPSMHALCTHEGKRFFSLKPDMLVTMSQRSWILDTKWKLIDQFDRENSYAIKQSDFYQLFAYGKKYLEHQEEGDVLLVYPKRNVFDAALPVFRFSSSLRLWVLPFDLETETLDTAMIAGFPVKHSTP